MQLPTESLLLAAGTVLASTDFQSRRSKNQNLNFFCAFFLIPNSPFTLVCERASPGRVRLQLEGSRRDWPVFFSASPFSILNLRACRQATGKLGIV